MKSTRLFCWIFGLTLSAAYAQPATQKAFQRQLIGVEDGARVELGAGRFALTGSLSMTDKKRVVIRGEGMDKTILSFKGQTDGAEGLRVSNGEDIVIENLTIEDTKGDCIKTMNVRGITFRNVRVRWTGKPSPTNGGYGLYPVQCQQVLIDSCEASGASDAGIYVGQSRGIVVRNSRAFGNVAGIEIENSIDAEVHHNQAFNNTGGLLVFDLPDLVQKRGGNCHVYENDIYDNNLPNFAPKGNIVATVPDGTGILLLAAHQVEIERNRIRNNRSIGTGIISYFMTENPITDKAYDPYPSGIYIHDNVYERAAVHPTHRGRMGLMFRFKLRFGTDVPHILYDGIMDPARLQPDGTLRPDDRICVRQNTNQSFVNLDAEHGFKAISRDATTMDCNLPAVRISQR
jgi:parallel beta-helix repeat protein